MDIKIGNLFESKAKTLVNTVNCVGVMGKGLAAEFKKRYPYMFEEYVQLCRDGDLIPGKPYLYKNLAGDSVLNFPTKNHWRSPSKMSYIIDGLDWFVSNYEEMGITSIAFPPLGCGNGGMDWRQVGPVMFSRLKDLPIHIEVYAPYGTNPEYLKESFLEKGENSIDKNAEGEKAPLMNKYWYLLLYVVQTLNKDPFAIRVGRTAFQKVCYIVTRSGLPTGFTFKAQAYGPYSYDVKRAVMALANANMIVETQQGRMIETIVSPSFVFNKDDFTPDEIECADRAIDLLRRLKSTEHAEIITTILFTHDRLTKDYTCVNEERIISGVLEWKPHWRGDYDIILRESICNLAMLGWLKTDISAETIRMMDELL